MADISGAHAGGFWGPGDEAGFRAHVALAAGSAGDNNSSWATMAGGLVDAALACKSDGAALQGFAACKWRSRANHPGGQSLTRTYLWNIANKVRRKARESLWSVFMSRQRELRKPKGYAAPVRLPATGDQYTSVFNHRGKLYRVTTDIVSVDAQAAGEFVCNLTFACGGEPSVVRSGVPSGAGFTFSAQDGPSERGSAAAAAAAAAAACVASRSAASAQISAGSAADAVSDMVVLADVRVPGGGGTGATAGADPTDVFMAELLAGAVDPGHSSQRQVVQFQPNAPVRSPAARAPAGVAALRARCAARGLSTAGTSSQMAARLASAGPALSPAAGPRAASGGLGGPPFGGFGHLCSYKGSAGGAWGKGSWHDCVVQGQACAETGKVILEHHDFGAAGTSRGDATLYRLGAAADLVAHGGGEWSWPGSAGDRIVLREKPRGGCEGYVFPQDGRGADKPARKRGRGAA
jgi:hypothetical protein